MEEKIVLQVCKLIYPSGDNHYVKKVKNDKWELGYTNDYPMQHGNGENICLPENIIELLYSNIRVPLIISEKKKAAIERGDGECPYSVYWYCAALHDIKSLYSG